MHHGEIREQGSHQDLLAMRGLYWKLYKLQYADAAHRYVEPAPSEQPLIGSVTGDLQFNE
jgi:ATP-binding cassette subfamily B protein